MKKALCFASGVLLSAALIMISVLIPALSTARFEQALLKTVNTQALGISQSDLSAFASETMAYLRGERDSWQPHIPHTGVPEAFSQHMAEVKQAVSFAPWLIIALVICSVLMLWLGGWQRRWALGGVLALIGLVALIVVWAAVDFHSFWMVLHKAFIKGGIFPHGEPVMQLFPLELFFQYIAPVCCMTAVMMAALCSILVFKHR